MSLPIKNTPELTGKDAKRFIERMKEADAGKRRVSPEDYARAKATYEAAL